MDWQKMAEVTTSNQVTAEVGHELSDLSPRRISFFAIGLAALVIIALLVCYGLLVWMIKAEARRAEPPNQFAVLPEPMVQPRLAVEPGRALKAMRRQEQTRLKGFGWVDQEKGIVHIPIERAMDMLVEKGLPARQSKPPEKNGGAKRVDARSGEPRS
jgi:nitrate reductase NapE component